MKYLSFSRCQCVSLFALALSLAFGTQVRAAAPAFSRIIVFGDSLSDTGNVRHRSSDATFGLTSYPSGRFNYSDGRFTNSSDTSPASTQFVGVWHEQLARSFLSLPPATNSLDGGLNYAFGGATTQDGRTTETIYGTSVGDITFDVDNLGKQLSDYLSSHTIDPNALYVVWGGGNDLFDDHSPANVVAAATRLSMLVSRLGSAGAKYILVPNVPPLGCIPRYLNDANNSDAMNKASYDFRTELNTDLKAVITSLNGQGYTPTIYRLDSWKNAVATFANPAGSYPVAFSNTTDSAQGKSVNPDQYLFWDDIHPTTAAHYQTAYSANNLISHNPPGVVAKAVNLSTRVHVDVGEKISIVGFFVTGDVSKKIIIRGLGSSLATNNVPNVLADPTLTLYDDAGNVLAVDDNWKDSQISEITASGIPPKNDAESAIVRSLAPGHYTAALAGKNNTTGNGLVEVYDLESNNASALANLSTRGYVGTNDDVMIGGLIIASGDAPVVVIRAIGPSLSNSNIATPLADPALELHDQNGALVSANDNWKDAQLQAVKATLLAPTNDKESALVVQPAPGSYTAIVRGIGGATGVALVEAYTIP